MSPRHKITEAKRIVIKIGTSLVSELLHSDKKIKIIKSICQQVSQLNKNAIDVLVVSSGAVASGMKVMNLQTRPQSIVDIQALAAIGQVGLINVYQKYFIEAHINCAQVLITHADLENRQRYLNARATLIKLLDFNTIPIINENDTVTIDEIRFGDNDTLAALVSNLVTADLMLLLTDQAGLLDAPPSENDSANLVQNEDVSDPRLMSYAGIGSELGRGGMKTKISAAKLAARSATQTVIANGATPNVILDIVAGKNIGTLLFNSNHPLTSRKNWILGKLKALGKVILDVGAVNALIKNNKSLLSVGVIECYGTFNRGDVVIICDNCKNEIGRGIINYNNVEVKKILGKPSEELATILGYKGEEELIHRDNLVIL